MRADGDGDAIFEGGRLNRAEGEGLLEGGNDGVGDPEFEDGYEGVLEFELLAAAAASTGNILLELDPVAVKLSLSPKEPLGE